MLISNYAGELEPSVARKLSRSCPKTCQKVVRALSRSWQKVAQMLHARPFLLSDVFWSHFEATFGCPPLWSQSEAILKPLLGNFQATFGQLSSNFGQHSCKFWQFSSNSRATVWLISYFAHELEMRRCQLGQQKQARPRIRNECCVGFHDFCNPSNTKWPVSPNLQRSQRVPAIAIAFGT